MELIVLCILYAIQTGHSVNVSISGKTYIQPGVPYNVSCTVDAHRDNRQTTFDVSLSSNGSIGTAIVWYYKPFGCFQLKDSMATDCRNASCACDDDGLTTHWTYETPLNLRSSVIFQCFTTNNDSRIITSDPFEATIPYGPGSSLIFNPSNDFETKELGQEFKVTCFAVCKPQCQFQWTKLTLIVSNGAKLHLPKLSKEDNGTYKCRAENGYGINGTKSLYLTVNYGPESVTLLPPDTQYTLTDGNNIPPISCTADCRPACNYMWSGPEIPAGTSNILSLQKIQKTQRGVYNCTAYNDVASFKSSDVNINVHFGPESSLQFQPNNSSLTKIKGDMLGPSICSATCNPPCKYTWTTPDDTIINGAQLIVSSLSIMDHGQFICTASNGIGVSQNKSLDVTVNFKPFLDTTKSNSPEKIATSENDYLFITVSVKSNPHPIIKWTFIAQDNIDFCNNSAINSTSRNVGFHSSSNITIDNLKKNQFGQYTFMASNVVGIFRREFSVFKKGEPTPPSFVYVVCKSTTAIVILKPILNGNSPQELYIQYTAGERQDMTSIKVHMNYTNQPIQYTVTGLNSGRKYNFSILAVNLVGETRSNQVECVTERLSPGQDMLPLKEDNSSMFSAGIASLVVGLLFFIAATIFIFLKRFKKSYAKPFKSDEYSNLQTSNPAFQDPYTSLQNPIESRHHQEPSTNTYEECGNASIAAAYQDIENMNSGHKKAETNMGIYDNMTI